MGMLIDKLATALLCGGCSVALLFVKIHPDVTSSLALHGVGVILAALAIYNVVGIIRATYRYRA